LSTRPIDCSMTSCLDDHFDSHKSWIFSSDMEWASSDYTFQTQAHVKKMKLQVRNPKHDCTIATFLLDIKKTVDTFFVVASLITNGDHLGAILDAYLKNTTPSSLPLRQGSILIWLKMLNPCSWLKRRGSKWIGFLQNIFVKPIQYLLLSIVLDLMFLCQNLVGFFS